MLQTILEMLDDYVARNGFGKLFAGGLSTLAVAGVFGSLFGAPWLRVATSVLLGCAVILLVTLLIAERRRLYHRLVRDAHMLARYTAALPQDIQVLDWSQEVTINAKGDAIIQRTVRLASAADDKPHYLNVNTVYYGSRELTQAAKRRVRVTAHRLAPGGEEREIRTTFTYIWTASRTNNPRNDVLVHLEGGVEEGEKVIVRWEWPAFSADLMSGRSGEDFDVYFRVVVAKFDYTIRLRDVSPGKPPSVSKKGPITLTHGSEQKDYVIKFSGVLPAAGNTQGIRIDTQPN